MPGVASTCGLVGAAEGWASGVSACAAVHPSPNERLAVDASADGAARHSVSPNPAMTDMPTTTTIPERSCAPAVIVASYGSYIDADYDADDDAADWGTRRLSTRSTRVRG